MPKGQGRGRNALTSHPRALALAACMACAAPFTPPAASASAPTIAPAAPETAVAPSGTRAGERPAEPRRGRIRARVTRHVATGRALRVRGRLRPGLRGRVIRLQLRTRRGWPTVRRVRTGGRGRFRLSWRPHAPGGYRLRVRFGGDRRASAAGRRLGRAFVYRAGQASWYGPGLYGNHTACGGTLTPSRLGVAHRWLPCGTRVRFRHRGRSVTVPVIDRGPFAGAREWDLTAATKSRLRFGDVGVVWSTR
jgi:rare lipoprotein A